MDSYRCFKRKKLILQSIILMINRKNMGLGTWIGAALGTMVFGPLGLLAGLILGNAFDKWQSESSSTDDMEREGRNSFLFSMLAMASYVIRADGKIMHSEMEYVRGFLREHFGSHAALEGNEILLKLFAEQKRMDSAQPHSFRRLILDCAQQMNGYLTIEQRLQLLNLLVGIAGSDGRVAPEEIVALRELSAAMGISNRELDSMLNLGGNTLEEAYKVLEIDATASDAEVKAAYRKLALKHHPDRVQTLGEDVRKAAELKFQKINEAKDCIYAERGLK